MVLHGFNTVLTLWLDKQRRIFSVNPGWDGIMAKPLNCCSVRFEGFLMRVVFGYEFNFKVSFTCLISS